jgi:hypothetical protein
MLNLNDLSAGQPGLTSESGGAMAQCASVCLESQGHTRGVELSVRGYIANNYILDWPPVTDQVRRTWADLREATEKGAEGIAILLLKQELGYAAIERAAIGTRIDRWLGEESDAPNFQRKARLEVSGILNGSDGEVKRRLREKIDQVNFIDSQLPAYVVVVEFSHPLAEVNEK